MILGKRRSSQRQSKTQAILATKALINKEISDEAIAKKEIEEKESSSESIDKSSHQNNSESKRPYKSTGNPRGRPSKRMKLL